MDRALVIQDLNVVKAVKALHPSNGVASIILLATISHGSSSKRARQSYRLQLVGTADCVFEINDQR
jgi:hypothetical protein